MGALYITYTHIQIMVSHFVLPPSHQAGQLALAPHVGNRKAYLLIPLLTHLSFRRTIPLSTYVRVHLCLCQPQAQLGQLPDFMSA
jgi:hypothetical protein